VKRATRKKPAKANIAFGDAVRRLRTKAGLSQEQLGELAGVHRNHIGDIERGEKEACLLTILGICRALRLPLSEFALEMER